MIHRDSFVHLSLIGHFRLPVFFLLALSVSLWATPEQCAGQDPVAVGEELLATDHPGDLPFATTVVEIGNGSLLVADLLSGLFYSYDVDDITASPDVLVGPLGTAVYTGLAWRDDDEDTLYWVVDDGDGEVIATSTTLGALGDTFTIDMENLELDKTPVLGDMTWNLETGTFWIADLANDIYFEVVFDPNDPDDPDTEATATGEFFSNPAVPSFGGGAYGNGIVAVPTAGDIPVRFDVPVGTPFDAQPTEVQRLFGDGGNLGNAFGFSYQLSGGNSLDGWITGIAYSDSGSTEFASEYLVNLTTNQIVEVQVEDPRVRSVTGLAAVVADGNAVELSWTNDTLATYSELTIERAPLGSIIFEEVVVFDDDIPESYVDEPDPPIADGSYTYRVTPRTSGTDRVTSALVDITVGPGTLLNVVPHEGDNPLGITIVDDEDGTGEIYVADLNSGLAAVYDKDLEFIETIDNPFGTEGNTTGIAYNSSTDTLFWYNDTAGELQETELDGTIPKGSEAIAMVSPLGGAVGDIAYNPSTDSYWGVDITFRAYFEFTIEGDAAIDGMLVEQDEIDGADIDFGNGVTAVPDESLVILDVPAGTSDAGQVDRVKRLLATEGSTSSISEFLLGPSTLSAFVNGIAYTTAGSQDPPNKALYVVGNDTNAVYEVNLESGILPDFIRGDCNADDDTDISDVTFLLFFLFTDKGKTPGCFDACDYDDDGDLSITDVTFLLGYQFEEKAEPPAPFPTCGKDETEDNLQCLVIPANCETDP